MAANKKLKITDCESCMYYDYDEYMEAYICTLDLDEDEMILTIVYDYSVQEIYFQREN